MSPASLRPRDRYRASLRLVLRVLVQGLGFKGLGFRVQGYRFRVYRFRVYGLGFWVGGGGVGVITFSCDVCTTSMLTPQLWPVLQDNSIATAGAGILELAELLELSSDSLNPKPSVPFV